MKAILIATKETIDVIKAGEYTNIYVTEDGKQSFLGDELILLDEVKEEAKGRDWEEVRINAAIATMQTLLNNPQYENKSIIAIADMSVSMADVLVKKLKGECVQAVQSAQGSVLSHQGNISSLFPACRACNQ